MTIAALARAAGSRSAAFSHRLAPPLQKQAAAVARLRARTSSPLQSQRRAMGGGQPVSQSMEARLFEGHPEEPEGWETTLYLTYGAGVVLIGLALGFAPDTSIKAWASGEAQARIDLKAAGQLDAPEFGTHYNVDEKKFDFDSINPDNPFNEEDDDDDDDEDEEEDDAEEDDDDDDE